MPADPKISVLMSVYNGERFLRKAIDSVLSQTFTDFEFIIINDGSTDSTREILESYRRADARIVVVSQPNQGLTRSLNTGLAMARAEVIARMDADDVSLPDRLALQFHEMASDSTKALVGCFYELIDAQGRPLGRIDLETHPIYRLWRLQFHNGFAHGSVMFNKRVVLAAGGYREDLATAQDYDLWLRISTAGNTCMVPRCLFRYRIVEGTQISHTRYETQTRTASQTSTHALRDCNPWLSEEDCKRLRSIYWDREYDRMVLSGLLSVPGTLRGFCSRYGLSAGETLALVIAVARDTVTSCAKFIGRPVLSFLRRCLRMRS